MGLDGLGSLIFGIHPVAFLGVLTASIPCGAIGRYPHKAERANQNQEALVEKAVQAPEEEGRANDAKNLRMIARAMLRHEDEKGKFPSAAICNKDDKPLLSWRVAILPYLGQNELYKRFKLDEPWDGANNRKLLPLMPKIYELSERPKNANSMTYYRVFVGDQAPFDKSKGLSIPDISDGTSDTLMVVEAAEAVPWTKPEDLKYDPDNPLPKLGTRRDGGFIAVFMDTHVHFFAQPPDEKIMRALITHSGREEIDPHYW
jgi:hypothetical protein